MSEEEPKPRKRRTPEEIRADLQAKLKELDEFEKRDVIRLLSGVHDDLVKASTFKQAPQPEVKQAIQTVKAALEKLGV